MAVENIAAVSTLVSADCFVDALISVDPAVPFADTSISRDFNQKEYNSSTTVYMRVNDQPKLPAQSLNASIDEVTEKQIALTALPYNDTMPMSSVQEVYDFGGEAGLRERLFKPRMESISVQGALNIYTALYGAMNFYGTVGSDLKTATDWGGVRAVLNNQLALDTGLCAAVSPRAMAAIAGDLATAFNPTDDSSVAYMQGRVKKAANINFYESTLIPDHTNGSAVGNGSTGMIVQTNVTTGATTVAVTGGTSSGTITANSIIWFSGAYAVQPHTKKALTDLRYFTVASLLTLSGGAGTLTVTEAIYGPENPKLQNISVLPTTANYVGIKGAASTTYEQAFWFKKKAFAFVTLKMAPLNALENKTMTVNDVTVQSVAFADGMSRQNYLRWDYLGGAAIKQWRHCGRSFVYAKA